MRNYISVLIYNGKLWGTVKERYDFFLFIALLSFMIDNT